jgi:hypothetical protein
VMGNGGEGGMTRAAERAGVAFDLPVVGEAVVVELLEGGVFSGAGCAGNSGAGGRATWHPFEQEAITIVVVGYWRC